MTQTLQSLDLLKYLCISADGGGTMRTENLRTRQGGGAAAEESKVDLSCSRGKNKENNRLGQEDQVPGPPFFFPVICQESGSAFGEVWGTPTHGYTVGETLLCGTLSPEETEAVWQELGGCTGHERLVLGGLPVPSKGST